MVGVPLYSDVDSIHDYVVQARGAFAETLLGVHNLGRVRVPVEIRIVLHRHSVSRLPQLAQFIYRNATFASHVAFMGLEVIGFAKANLNSLWIDPMEYAEELEQAVELLDTAGLSVSIYNHQLCTLSPTLWRFSRKSISDWKNDYASECAPCTKRAECGGFFSWNLSVGRSRGIRPL